MMEIDDDDDGLATVSQDDLQKQKEMLFILEPRKFNLDVLTQFFCQHFKVDSPEKIDPHKGRIHAHSLMKEVVLGFEVVADFNGSSANDVITVPFTSKMLNSDQPVEKVSINGTALAGDLQHACVYHIICRHVAIRHLSGAAAVRLNFYHKGVNKVQKAQKIDELVESAKGIKGAFMAIYPHTADENGRSIESVPLHQSPCCNEWFNRTMALVNERNMLNDIIEIPYEVCLAAGLPVVLNNLPQSDFMNKFMQQVAENATADGKEAIRTFYAIPGNHVLSWPLQSNDFAARCEFRARRFDVNGKTLFHLVSKPDFDRMVYSFKRTMLDKVDMRPLSSMAMEFVPMSINKPLKGSIKLRCWAQYMVPPLKKDGSCISQQTIDNLAVTLAPGVLSPDAWIPETE
ncbi:MAG: hypothetical protein K2Q45_02540 [Nitrosomonas sp.]|nr:hypothetical protein [Nitrosomonas sp.]